ncbi:MAG: VOC family protein [Candidatus Binatia bacterium]|nr:VOC family protein [Candidatus Binatia bacterium]
MLPIPIRGLDHIVLRTDRLEELLVFYRDGLGCAVEKIQKEIGLYQLRAGSALIDIVDGKIWKTEAGPGESLYDHFCLQIASSDAGGLVAELDRRGIPHGDPADRYGATGPGISVYANDPDGRTVEFKLVGPNPR